MIIKIKFFLLFFFMMCLLKISEFRYISDQRLSELETLLALENIKNNITRHINEYNDKFNQLLIKIGK